VKKMVNSRQDVMGVNIASHPRGKIVMECDQIKYVWRKYMGQEAQLMLTNPRNAFRGQSRS